MPRAKAVKKTKFVNDEIINNENPQIVDDLVSTTTTNGVVVEVLPVKAVAVASTKSKSRAKKAPADNQPENYDIVNEVHQPKTSKKTTTNGRGKKKVTEGEEEQSDSVVVNKKNVVKGRSKKELAVQNEVVPDEKVHVPAKQSGSSRGKKQQKAFPTVENNDALDVVEAATKTETKVRAGRKNKETESSQVAVDVTEKVSQKNRAKKETTKEVLVKSPIKEKLSSRSKKQRDLVEVNDVVTTEEENGNLKQPTKRSRNKVKSNDVEKQEVEKTSAKIEKKQKLEQEENEVTKPVGEKRKRGVKVKETKNVKKDIQENNEDVIKPVGKSRAKKRIAVESTADDDEKIELDGSKPSKSKKTEPLINSTHTNYNKDDFTLPTGDNINTSTLSDSGEHFNFKISSWNVAGLRAWLKKDGMKFLDFEEPDIFCMQETKCATEQLPDEVKRIPGYHPYWLCMPGGYAGVAIYSKIMPIHVEYGIGNAEFDENGRIITAEYEKFYLINVYVPNSGRKLVNLESRMRWEDVFQGYVQKLDKLKPVVICGDMNVSHLEIDLANPKSNTRNAGFTKEERDKMSELLSLGYVDTFRHLYPDRTGAYTFWTYMGNARARNVGWRLDYFIVSERFVSRVIENCMRNQCMGSDHCPITLFLKV